MSVPKTFPPYRVENMHGDLWIVDSSGNDVVTRICLSRHYADANGFPNGELWNLICNSLNAREARAEGVSLNQMPTPETDASVRTFEAWDVPTCRHVMVEYVFAHKAKDLERRLTVAREALGRLEKLSLCGRAYEEIEQTLTQTAPKQ